MLVRPGLAMLPKMAHEAVALCTSKSGQIGPFRRSSGDVIGCTITP